MNKLNKCLNRSLVTLLVTAVVLMAQATSVLGVTMASAASNKTVDESVLQIKFDENAGVNLQGKSFVSSTGKDLSAINSALNEAKVSRKDRLFSESADKISARRQEIKQRTGKVSPDLNSYYRLHLQKGYEASKLSQQLKQLANVSEAYAEPLPAPAPTTPSFVSLQKSLTTAPVGMGVSDAAIFPATKGGNVKIADLEYSWNTAHEDISKARATGARIANGTPVDPFNDNNHGTAVAGIISGDLNSFGVNGIASDAGFRMVNTNTAEQGWNVANAVYLAQANLAAGDVILIEQQVWGPVANMLAPVEWTPAVYDAIKMATDSGEIVVEAAANSGQNLDDPIYGTTFPAGKADSGAIIVGAGAACGTSPYRSRLPFSNYGRRVDVQGYGECVMTTGVGNYYGYTDPNSWYTNTFNGTSSAAALVAAVSASISSSYKQINGVSPSSAILRGLLISTGSAQDNSVNKGIIGPLPNELNALKLSDRTAPTAPSSVTVARNRKNDLVLNWIASTDNAGIASYQIYRNGAYIATTTSNTFTDTTVAASTQYGYQISAQDIAGNFSILSNTVSSKTR